MASGSLGSKRPKKPHLLNNGLGGEVKDLRDDVDSALAAVELRMKYIFAKSGQVHMRADDDFLTGLAALPPATTLAQACLYANALKASELEHFDSVGSLTTDGSHQAADPINKAALQAVTDLTELSSATELKDMIAALDAARFNHASAVDGAVKTHFVDDVEENNANISFADSLVLSEQIQNLNDLREIFRAHFARAAELEF